MQTITLTGYLREHYDFIDEATREPKREIVMNYVFETPLGKMLLSQMNQEPLLYAPEQKRGVGKMANPNYLPIIERGATVGGISKTPEGLYDLSGAYWGKPFVNMTPEEQFMTLEEKAIVLEVLTHPVPGFEFLKDLTESPTAE